jgi:hypothetical protein
VTRNPSGWVTRSVNSTGTPTVNKTVKGLVTLNRLDGVTQWGNPRVSVLARAIRVARMNLPAMQIRSDGATHCLKLRMNRWATDRQSGSAANGSHDVHRLQTRPR